MVASLDSWKTTTDIVSNVVTVAAIGVGGAWAYWRFVRERTRWPRALLELVVIHRSLTAQRTLLNVTLKVHNAGVGLMRLTDLRVYVYRVRPVRDATRRALSTDSLVAAGKVEAEWPCIKKSTRTWEPGDGPEVEPNENDEYVHDFVVSSDVQTVFIYAYLGNEKRARGARQLGWQVTTFYDLSGAAGEGRADNLVAGGLMGEYSEKQQRPRPEPEPEKIEEGQQEPRPEPQPEREPEPEQQPPPKEREQQDGSD